MEEMASIDNNRLFIVDNLAGAGPRLGNRPLQGNDSAQKEVVLPSDRRRRRGSGSGGAGGRVVCLSDHFRLLRLHPRPDQALPRSRHRRGRSILLGLDYHTEDYIKRWMDFLLEIELDMAEFTILTPLSTHARLTTSTARVEFSPMTGTTTPAAKWFFSPK